MAMLPPALEQGLLPAPPRVAAARLRQPGQEKQQHAAPGSGRHGKLLGLGCLGTVSALVQSREARGRARGSRAALRALEIERPEVACARLEVPVRSGKETLVLKRFMAAPKEVSQLPRYKPAILVVHSGPGNNSRYLEPMAVRLCDVQGRSCYLYDQLQGGHNRRSRLKHDTRDLLDVANYMLEHLGEPEIHIIAHGFGGVIVMEALVRMKLWEFGGISNCLPKMRSVCLLGTPSSSVLLQSESKRLLQLTQRDSSEEAKSATSFWFKHYCSLRSPSCLENVYNRKPLGGWEPWDTWVLRGWEMSRSELAEEWAASTSSAPLLMVRGENDFVTEACMEAWRGAQDSLQAAALEGRPCSMGSLGFQEKVIPRSGHNAHLEEPEVFSALLHEWLDQVEGAL